MKKRIGITILLCSLGVLTTYAQWSRQDSVKLRRFLSGDEEIKLNDRAVKSIRFGLPKEQLPNLDPIMSMDKPSLKFNEELPDIFSDSLAKYRVRPTLRPYNIFTRYNEDPIHAPDNCFSRSWASKLFHNTNNEFDVRMQRVSAGRRSDDVKGFGVGYSFSMEDVLQQLFSKKGRARLRNAKNANAWKTY